MKILTVAFIVVAISAAVILAKHRNLKSPLRRILIMILTVTIIISVANISKLIGIF